MVSPLHRIARAARRSPPDTALALFAIVVATWAIAAPFVAARYPPMTDFPFHAAQAGTLRHYLDPAYHQREQFRLQPLAVPYLSMYVIGALFMVFFPMIIAVKLAAATMLVLLPGGLAVMFHGMKKSPLLGLLGLGLVWCYLTEWGFLNYVGALGLFAMCVGFTFLVVDRPTAGRKWGLALSLVALFFTHIFRFPFAICAVFGTAIVMYPATRRFSPVVLPTLPSLGLFAIWLRVRPKTLDAGKIEYAFHKERLLELPGLLYGSFSDPAEKPAFHLFFQIACYVAILSAAAWLWRALGRGAKTTWAWDIGTTIVPLACAGAFLLCFLVMPMWLGVWWYVYPREATALALILLGACPDLPRSFWLRAPLVAALAVGGLRITNMTSKNYAKFNEVTEDFHTITREIPLAPKLLYLVFDHNGSTRTTTPFIHLPAYVQAEKGGWLSFHFAIWDASPVAYRSRTDPAAVVPPVTPGRWEWRPEVFNVMTHGPFFNWFLVRKASSPDDLFKADPTIVPVKHVGTWWLYRRKAP